MSLETWVVAGAVAFLIGLIGRELGFIKGHNVGSALGYFRGWQECHQLHERGDTCPDCGGGKTLVPLHHSRKADYKGSRSRF